MSAVKDVALRPVEELAPERQAEVSLSIFERLARDPQVDVDRLERLIQMHERGTARIAAEQFNAAMTAAQRQMQPVAADAYNPQTRSKYASYEALDRALRPIYTDHGFGLSFNTDDCPMAEAVRVVCRVTHLAGHAERYHVDIPADGKGAKGGDVMTRTHATGAAVSYGMRYLLKMIFNVAVGEGDDDGNSATAQPAKVDLPKGYDQWLPNIRAAAKDGLAVFRAAWKESALAYRQHVEQHDKALLRELEALVKKAGTR